jgi:lipopolysaccharide transport system ATP-binding protein
MRDIAIKIENMGKLYRIGAQQGYRTLRETLVSKIKRLNIKRLDQKDDNSIWALKDVSFEVKQGEVVGIIGRNGAGKSTLLKVLSHITEPTQGRVSIYGRVGSLLEVGTGFHPELTGRENIYLNGAILGMKRAEIDRKFDEIVTFAEIEKFLDTPSKRYSSGMYLRLAFAVAAHLEPEILMVDEVLAVGDIGFQKKCLGKMGEVGREGRTILLVSHNMSAIGALCSRSIWLESGKIRKQGVTAEVIAAYEESVTGKTTGAGSKIIRLRTENRSPYIKSFEIRGSDNSMQSAFSYGEHLNILVQLDGELPPASYLEWEINSRKGHRVSSGGTFMQNDFKLQDAADLILCSIGPLTLAQGGYNISLKYGVLPGTVLDAWDDAFPLNILECDPEGTGFQFDLRRGDVYIPATYKKLSG